MVNLAGAVRGVSVLGGFAGLIAVLVSVFVAMKETPEAEADRIEVERGRCGEGEFQCEMEMLNATHPLCIPTDLLRNGYYDCISTGVASGQDVVSDFSDEKCEWPAPLRAIRAVLPCARVTRPVTRVRARVGRCPLPCPADLLPRGEPRLQLSCAVPSRSRALLTCARAADAARCGPINGTVQGRTLSGTSPMRRVRSCAHGAPRLGR